MTPSARGEREMEERGEEETCSEWAKAMWCVGVGITDMHIM